jgi:hypothetical protein
MLPTGRVVSYDVDLSLTARPIEIELGEPDFIKFRALAQRGGPAASLSEAWRVGLVHQDRDEACVCVKPAALPHVRIGSCGTGSSSFSTRSGS